MRSEFSPNPALAFFIRRLTQLAEFKERDAAPDEVAGKATHEDGSDGNDRVVRDTRRPWRLHVDEWTGLLVWRSTSWKADG
jgi:hypothetical protein